MPNKLPRSTRIYLRRRKAELRRTSDNPDAAIEALMRQYPRPTPSADAAGRAGAGAAEEGSGSSLR